MAEGCLRLFVFLWDSILSEGRSHFASVWQFMARSRRWACTWGIEWIFQSNMIALQVIAFCHVTQLGSCWCEVQSDSRGSFLGGFCNEMCFCYRSAWEPVSVEGLTFYTTLKPSNLLYYFFKQNLMPLWVFCEIFNGLKIGVAWTKYTWESFQEKRDYSFYIWLSVFLSPSTVVWSNYSCHCLEWFKLFLFTLCVHYYQSNLRKVMLNDSS